MPEGHQSCEDLSFEDHNCPYRISQPSVVWLMRYFSLDESGESVSAVAKICFKLFIFLIVKKDFSKTFEKFIEEADLQI